MQPLHVKIYIVLYIHFYCSMTDTPNGPKNHYYRCSLAYWQNIQLSINFPSMADGHFNYRVASLLYVCSPDSLKLGFRCK